MTFRTAGDNRYGSASVDTGDGNQRTSEYNIDPSSLYLHIQKSLAANTKSGSGLIAAQVDTDSQFVNVQQGQCDGLTFSTRLSIQVPGDGQSGATASVADRLSMGINIAQTGSIRLKTSIVSDVDLAFIRLIGPTGATPLNDPDKADQVIQIATTGIYTLLGSARMAVRLPNNSLGGRPLVVQMSANLSAA